jgi:hypothetical protein
MAGVEREPTPEEAETYRRDEQGGLQSRRAQGPPRSAAPSGGSQREDSEADYQDEHGCVKH